MARGIPAYLQEDERVVARTDRHRASVLDELGGILFLAAILTTALLVYVMGYRPDLWWPLGWLGLAGIAALAAWMMLLRWWRTVTSQYTLTDVRVYRAYGRLRWSVSQTTFDKLTDLHIRQGIWGRILGYGTIRLETAGSGMVLSGVRDPFAFKQQIEEARTEFLHTLVGEAPAPSPETPTAPKRSGMGSTRWESRPAPSSGIGGVLASLAFLAVAALMLVATLLGGERNLFMVLVPATIGIFTAIRLAIFLTCTRYLVLDGGVVVTSGWLTRRRVEATYSKVTDVQTTQNVFGRIFGFGEIRINTAGSNEAPIVFQGVSDPDGVKRLIDEARS